MHSNDELYGKDIIRTTPKCSPLRAQLLLAHGAGAPMDSPILTQLAEIVSSACGLEVIRFEFDYMRQRRHGGSKRPPPKIDVLVQEWHAWLKRFVTPHVPLLLGGKSMGGRVATMLNSPKLSELPQDTTTPNVPTVNEPPWHGAVCFGYPFHPPRNPSQLRTDHLQKQSRPTLIIQGSHDPFGKSDEVATYSLGKDIILEWILTANHDLKPLKKSGLTHQAALLQCAHAISAFMDDLSL